MTQRRRASRVGITVSLTFVMVATGLVVAPGGQAQSSRDETEASSVNAEVDGPTDPFRAIAEAAATDAPVVIDTYTSATTEILANPDGTFTARIAPGPVRIPDPSSSSGWAPIDTTLVQTTGGIQPKAAFVDITFPDGSGRTASLAAGSRSFAINWPSTLPQPSLSGDTATYAEVLPDIDLMLRATPAGFEQSFVLNSPPKVPLALQVPLDLEGLVPKIEADGSLTLSTSNGDVFAQSDPALMWDSSYDDHMDASLHRTQVKTSLIDTPTGSTLLLTPDPAFLADPDLIYPVIIDPTVDLSVSQDTYVEILFPNQTYSTDNELKVGAINSGGQTQKARSFIKFGLGPIPGTHVTNATLKLYENHSYSCTGKKVNVYRLTSSWSGPTWNNQPSYGGIYASKTFAYGYSGSCPDQWVSISGGGANGNTLTDLVQGWASGSMANHGLAVRADSESDLASWKEFYSSDHGWGHPQLEVTYNSYPNTPTSLSPASGGYQATLTPELNGKYSDPDGGTGRVNYEVRLNSNGNLVVASSTTRTPKATSGSLHPWTISDTSASVWSGTPHQLINGTTYKWRARGDDGTDVSAWTSYRTFTVDTTAPTTPTISSSTHPSQTTWYSASLDDVSTSWTTSSDSTSGVAGYAVVWDQDANTIPSGATQTGTTFSQNNVSPAGIWYLHVRPKDNAGNWGSTATFAVHLGQVAVTKPSQGDESVLTFTLAGSADPSQSTATFQYRHSPSDTTCGSSEGDWCVIPAADLGLGSTTITLDGSGNTGDVTWDASATLGALATPVQVRLMGGLGASSDPVDLAFVPNSSEAIAPAGPGSVDLSTGNLTLTASDVSILGLGVFRTFNSRTSDDPSAGIFGPGWASGLESYSAYVALDYDSLAGTVTIETVGGQPLAFMKDDQGDFESPETAEGEDDAVASLTLENGVFTLTEHDGIATVFELQSGSPLYMPKSISTPAGESTVQTFYEVDDGVARPTKMIDAVPTGVSGCTTSPAAGCRLLTFTYATTTTATGTSEANWGDYTDRVKTISFIGYDPSTSAMETVAVASYLYDSNGRLRSAWDPRISPVLKTRYAYDSSGHVSTLTPPGLNAWTFTYGTIAGDSNDGRLLSISRPGDPSGTATTTFAYRVPISGTGAPYAMGASSVDDWGQLQAPATATAIFPPGHDPSGSPPSSYEWASVQYLDREGRVVDVASSDGQGGAYVAATEYDEFGNISRSLTAANRGRILAGVPDASVLWTRNVYSAGGVDLLETFGPMHAVQLADGSIQQAQAHITYSYDETPPQGVTCPCHLVTTTTEGARVQGTTSDADVRTTETTYHWGLLAATGSIVDPAGLALETMSLLDPDTGQVTETRMPANPDGGDAHSALYVYYATSGSDSGCHDSTYAKWANMLCKVMPAAQPSTGNNLPVTTFEYDLWGNVTEKAEVVSNPSATRTTTFTYDDAGRPQTTSLFGPGTAVPDVTDAYDSNTGLLTTTSTSAATIARSYDALGRLDSYEDADGNVSTYAYDLQDRPSSINDGKGTYTLSYDQGDERRGLLTTLADSEVGSFGAAYDPDGAPSAQTYPNGMTATTVYNELSTPVSLTYTKTSNCSTDCDWFVDEVIQSIHGQWLEQSSSLSDQVYSYDTAGRLTLVDDTPATPGIGLPQCTRRAYAYDADSNRTSLTSWDPNPTTGECNSTGSGTVVSSTYDEADRATKSGYTFDAFGRITQVPAVDAGGSQTTLSYHVNDRVRSLSISGASDTVSIDPMNRTRILTTPSATQTWHYAGDSDSPTWIAENTSETTWSRYVAGPTKLMVAAVDQAGTALLHLTNLHGDVVATASTSATATSLASAGDQTEFGIPRTSSGRHGWLGGYGRAKDSATATLLMGARVYLPTIGRFLQVDPVVGGAANPYDYALQDPLGVYDLSGTDAWEAADVPCPTIGPNPNCYWKYQFGLACWEMCDTWGVAPRFRLRVKLMPADHRGTFYIWVTGGLARYRTGVAGEWTVTHFEARPPRCCQGRHLFTRYYPAPYLINLGIPHTERYIVLVYKWVKR
jgi:RHS repeat-associated protein